MFSENAAALHLQGRSKPPRARLALLVLAGALLHCPQAEVAAAGERVRDRLWAWAHDAGVYNGNWGLPKNSRITPVEGALYLGLQNIIFIRYQGRPAPPFHQYALPFRSMERVVWSVTGANGATSVEERNHVFQLAASMTNVVGVFMDDFFDLTSGAASTAALSVEQLREIRQQLQLPGRRLDLGVTLYTHQLTPRIKSHLELCDVISLWTWKSEDLKDLELNFEKLRPLAAGKKILLGCYLWDFGNNRPMPLDRMQRQSALGLRWLKEGKISGLIFLATNVCDLDLPTVEWTRQWIAQVADDSL